MIIEVIGMAKMVICKRCGRRRKHLARGMCSSCYNTTLKRKMIVCGRCGRKCEHYAKGLCTSCYHALLKNPNAKPFRPLHHTSIICKRCKKKRKYWAKGLCRSCYNATRERKITVCKRCRKLKKHEAKGLCASCYSTVRQNPFAKLRVPPKIITCKECGKERRHYAKEMCQECYRTFCKNLNAKKSIIANQKNKKKEKINKCNFNNLMFWNEKQFEKWFKKNYRVFGIKRIIAHNRYPDFYVETFNNEKIFVELEYNAESFRQHNHYGNQCDLIISFIKSSRHNQIKGVPILSIFDTTLKRNSNIFNFKTKKLTPYFAYVDKRKYFVRY